MISAFLADNHQRFLAEVEAIEWEGGIGILPVKSLAGSLRDEKPNTRVWADRFASVFVSQLCDRPADGAGNDFQSKQQIPGSREPGQAESRASSMGVARLATGYNRSILPNQEQMIPRCTAAHALRNGRQQTNT